MSLFWFSVFANMAFILLSCIGFKINGADKNIDTDVQIDNSTQKNLIRRELHRQFYPLVRSNPKYSHNNKGNRQRKLRSTIIELKLQSRDKIGDEQAQEPRTKQQEQDKEDDDEINHCYYFSNVATSRNDAMERCNRYGLDLVSFETEEEYLHILPYIFQLNQMTVKTSNEPISRGYWTSASNLKIKNLFLWYKNDTNYLPITWLKEGMKKYRCPSELVINGTYKDCLSIQFWREEENNENEHHDHCLAPQNCNAVQNYWICENPDPNCKSLRVAAEKSKELQVKTNFHVFKNNESVCYYFSKFEATREEGRKACTELGGDLVAIETEEEEKILENVLQKVGDLYEKYWTSGYNLFPNSLNSFWFWQSTGQTMNYINWRDDSSNSNQKIPAPTRGDESCLAIFTKSTNSTDKNYIWRGYSCLAVIGFFICEKTNTSGSCF